MLDRVPKTTKKGEIARTTKVEKAWLILEAQNWAGEVYDLDQAWRKSWPSEEDFKVLDAKMIDLHLPFEKWREFLVTNQDPQHDQIRTELSQYF